jgi:hypothetical protein
MYTGENRPMRERGKDGIEIWLLKQSFSKSIQEASRIFINIDHFNKAGINIKDFAHIQKVLIYIYRP